MEILLIKAAFLESEALLHGVMARTPWVDGGGYASRVYLRMFIISFFIAKKDIEDQRPASKGGLRVYFSALYR